MDKIIEQLSQLDKEILTSETTFASEIEQINLRYNDNTKILKDIHKEVGEIITQLASRVAPLEKQLESISAEIKQKTITSIEITSNLESKELELKKSIEDKTATIFDLEQKLSAAQELVKSYLDEKEKINGALSSSRVALNLAEKNAKEAKEEVLDAQKEVEKARKEWGDISNEKDILNADIRLKNTMIVELATAEREVIEKRLKELE
jgi:chromosome segregation ATPase